MSRLIQLMMAFCVFWCCHQSLGENSTDTLVDLTTLDENSTEPVELSTSTEQHATIFHFSGTVKNGDDAQGFFTYRSSKRASIIHAFYLYLLLLIQRFSKGVYI